MSALGRPFDRFPTMFVKDCGYIPVVLTNAAFVIEKNIKTKGVFQTQGNVAKINTSLNRLGGPRIAKIKNENVHDVVEAMKAFLVHLPEPLLPEIVSDALMSISREETRASQYVAILTMFRNLSPHTFAILHFMMLLLKRISEFSYYNGMDVRKLATVFVLDIIKPLKLDDASGGFIIIERMQRLPYLIMVVENIINQVDIFKTICNMKRVVASPKDTPNPTENCSIEDVSTFSNNTKDCEQSMNNGNNTHKGNGESGVMSTDLLTRASSEPQKEVCSSKICKRCSTAVPVCTSYVASKISDICKGNQRDVKDRMPANGDNILNPIEVSLEPVVETPVGIGFKPRKQTPVKITAFGGKMSQSTGTYRRLPAKREHDETAHNLADIKFHKLVEWKSSNIIEKRKRKSRSITKKTKHEQERSNLDTSFKDSEFTIFQPDEEITPWKEASSNSDDTSVMAKTIRNPRILAYKMTTPITPISPAEKQNTPKIKERFIAPEKVPHLLLVGSGFRTISRQKHVSSPSESSDSSKSSLASYSANMITNPTPDVCVQYSSHEATPISKELIRGVKLKGSIGVNTSPFPETAASNTKNDKVSDKLEVVPKAIAPVVNIKEKVVCPKIPLMPVGKVTSFDVPTPSSNVAPPAIDVDISIKAPAGFSLSHKNGTSSQPQRPPLPVSQVAVRNDRPITQVRFRPNQIRRSLSNSADVQRKKFKTPSHIAGGISIGELFIDIILVCITLFCISLVFVFHEYNKV